MMLWQSSEISTVDDAFYARIRSHIPPGALTAVVPGNFPFVSNNFNAYVDIPSIHTYNSLSAERYQRFIESMGGEFTNYGRRNSAINPDYESVSFWMSNIGLVVAPIQLRSPKLQKVDTLPGNTSGQAIFLYSVSQRMGRALVVSHPEVVLSQPSIEIQDPRLSEYEIPRIIDDSADRLVFSVAVDQPSLLLVSQKYHPQWHAEVFDGQRWLERPIVEVNGIFQGVSLTPDDTIIRLSFRPYARWMWVVHLFWAGFVSYIGFMWVRARKIVADKQRSCCAHKSPVMTDH
jgi:hypothetical protein